MDNRIIELLREEIRETKNLVKAVQEETREIKRQANAAEKKQMLHGIRSILYRFFVIYK